MIVRNLTGKAFAAIALSTFALPASAAIFTCRGTHETYGQVAITMDSGPFATFYVRSCPLVKELADQLGAAHDGADTYVLRDLNPKCALDQKPIDTSLKLFYGCEIKPRQLGTSLNDEVGKELKMRFTDANLRIATLSGGEEQILVSISRGGQVFNRDLRFSKLACEDGSTISENEGRCSAQ